jgi:predicted RND superfamily exporter protein
LISDMKERPSFFARYSLAIMAVCIFLLPFAVIGSLNAKKANKNDVRAWIPKEYEETRVYNDFRKIFQGEEFVLISWDSCNRSNSRMNDLALKLLPPLKIYYRGENAEQAVSVDDYELAKLAVERRFDDEQRAKAAETGVEAKPVQLHYSRWLHHADTELDTLYIFANAEDEGDEANPNKDRAYARLERDQTGYFKSIMTGPRALTQITSRNNGFSEDDAAEGLSGALFAPPWVLRRDLRIMIDDKPIKVQGESIDMADGFLTVDGQRYTVNGKSVSTANKSVWVDATPVHKFDAQGRGIDPTAPAKDQKILADEEITYIGLNLRQSCVVVTLSEKGLAAKKQALEELRHIAIDQCSIPVDKLRIGGPPVDNVAIDEAGNKSLNLLAGVAVVIGFIVSWFSLKSFKLVAIVISAGIYSSILSLSLVWYCGSPVDAILFTMPSLVYVATTSGAIHLSNYYRDVRLEGLPAAGAGGAALHHAALPLSLATGTTAVGLATLCYTELIPIYYFGLYSAIGVLVSALLLVFYVPAALELWKPDIAPKAPGEVEDPETHSSLNQDTFWWRVGQWVLLNNKKVSFACLAVMIAVGWGISYNEISVQLMRLLSPRERILADYAYLESKLGPLVPMEVVLRLPVPNPADEEAGRLKAADGDVAQLRFVERLRLIRTLQDSVEKLSEVGSTMTTLTFMQDPDQLATGLPAKIQDSVRNKQLLKNRDSMLSADYLRQEITKGQGGKPDKYEEIWRISARVSALKNVDYAAFISELKKSVEPVIAQYLLELHGHGKVKNAVASIMPSWVDPRGFRDNIHVEYTGVVPLVYKAQHSLMDGLVWGFLTDFALIVAVMMIVCRDWSAGLVLLFPSAFPAVVVFGGMGWIHHALQTMSWGSLWIDIGYVMAPAVALGVTVDDVVHFMLWFQRGIQEGKTRKASVELAFRGCARAMYQSWGVIGIGLSVFSLSPFMPTRNFGIMMISMLTVALAGNLLMLPAVLAGPGGQMFAWGIRRKENRRRAKLGLPLMENPDAPEPTSAPESSESSTPAATPTREAIPTMARAVAKEPVTVAAPVVEEVAEEEPVPMPLSKMTSSVNPAPASNGSTNDGTANNAAAPKEKAPSESVIPEPHLHNESLRRTFRR